MYKRVVWVYFIMFVLLMFGCSQKQMITESGQPVPKELAYAYTFLDYNNNLSDLTGEITSDLYKSGDLSEEKKEKIGEVWKKHKRYSNELQVVVKDWYNVVDEGKEISNIMKVEYFLGKISNNTDIMTGLLKETGISEEELKLYISISEKIFELYTVIKE